MLKTIRHLLELIRFSHTLFALPFALLAAVMAWHVRAIQVQSLARNVRLAIESYTGHAQPAYELARCSAFRWKWQEIVGIMLCMVTARSFAMAWNRLVDSRLDASNPRTMGRHLPARILSVPQVAAFAAACAIGFVVSTCLFLPNRLPLFLAVPVLVFLAGYSYAKRFTALAHFWLGAALALSPVAAWIAIRGNDVIANPADLLPALVLGGAVLTWVAGFDMIYACQDYEFDRAAKLHSIPAQFGIPGALHAAAGCHFLTVVLLACLPAVFPPFGWLYWTGLAVVGVLLVYEHLLVRPDDLSRVNAAFFHINAVISLGLLVVGSLDLLIAGAP